MADPITEGINAQLDEENRQLRQRVDLLENTIRTYHMQATAQSKQLDQMVQYLPQLTNLATNTAYVASAIQAQTSAIQAQMGVLERIAKKLEEK